MDGNQSIRSRAEQLFNRYLDALQGGRASEAEQILADCDEETQPELERILADFEFLREQMGGTRNAFEAGRVVGDFELVQEVGRGGMGVVWEARQVSLDRRVALKVLSPQLSLLPRWLERFQREAEAGSRLNHAGIVTVYSIGDHEGSHYIAQELVPAGYTLADYLTECRAERDLPRDYYRRTAEMFRDMASALHAAHEEGIVHRDIKPGNVLLAEGMTPKIADFGLAKMADGGLALSHTAETLGTPYYMSPEQVEKRVGSIDARTDQFSLGVALYEALTLRLPFEGDTPQQVAHKILNEDPLDPSRLRSRVPRELAVICLKALEKPPERRYRSCGELADDLQRFLDDRPIHAKPPGPLARSAKWVRRHKAVAAGITVALVSSVVIFSLFAEKRAESIRADVSATTADEVGEFLVKLFGEADPTRSRGADFPVRHVLDAGARLIETELTDQPEVRATMMDTIGWVEFNLGRFDESRALLEEAYAIRLETLGPEDPATLEARFHLAEQTWEDGDVDRAEQIHREVLAARKRTIGEDDHDTMESKVYLALLLQKAGRLEEALELHQEAQDDHVRAFGADHEETMVSWIHVATVLQLLGRVAEAGPLVEKSIEGCIRQYGPDHYYTLVTKARYARWLSEADRKDEALALALEIVPVMDESVGLNRGTFYLHGFVAALLEHFGRDSEAESYYRNAHRSAAEFFGDEARQATDTLLSLAKFQERHNRLHEAATNMERVFVRRVSEVGPDDPRPSGELEALVEIELEIGDPTRALLEHAELLHSRRRAHREKNPSDYYEATYLLSRVKVLLAELEAAVPLAREAYEGTAEARGADNARTLEYALDYAAVLLDLDRVGEARVLLEDVASRASEGDRRHRRAVRELEALGAD